MRVLKQALRLVLIGWAGAGGLFLPSVWAEGISHGVAAVSIKVVQNDTNNTTGSVTVTTTVSVNGFSIRSGSNRGDYNAQIGLGFSDDVETGVPMTCVAENGRDNGEEIYPGTNYCTSAVDYSRSGAPAGAYFIPVFNAPTGAEYNMNVAAAFFPYNQWLGGYARNSGDTNGGANDLFTGSPGLALGTHYVDNGGGVSTVNLTSRGVDSRTDGVLLVTHGGNEDNYATSQVNSNNGTWTVYVKDNGANAEENEQDPVAFVFIPKTNTAVISGRFRGDGTRLMFSGATPQFNVVNTSTGTWRLTISGHSPVSGVLIISAEGGLSYNQDNIVSYEPDADGWLIQSRDLPPNPPTLQTPGGGSEPVASFVFIPAAATATLVSPADHAQGLGTSPTLQVAVSNAAAGSLTMRFFGREITPGPDFTIAVLPDTQMYTGQLNGGASNMMIAQTEWAITNRVAYVTQLGDISNNGDTPAYISQWYNATNAMYRLENPARTQLPDGMAYGVAVGNHEQTPIGNASGTTSNYNRFFGVSHFAGRNYYAGHYGTNNNNHFDFFSTGGLDFVVLYFEYDANANPAVLAWGDEVLRTNAHRHAIIVTHNFGNTATPLNFSAQGLAIFNALKTNANVFLMLGGHVTGEGSRVDTYNGNVVRTLVQDFQGWTNGGNGFMRIMDFSPSNNVVSVETFSPWTGEAEQDEDSRFLFNYHMVGPPGSNGGIPDLLDSDFNELGALSNVAPGSVVSLVWPGRQHSTMYEWYVTLTDAAGNTSYPASLDPQPSNLSRLWAFTTGPNLAPLASNQLVTIFGDAPTNLTLVAFDPNGDPLTYRTNSLPTHGVNLAFDTNNGIITYLPVRGSRGSDRFTYQVNDGFANSTVATMNLNVVSPPDTDANGLPDAWEVAYAVTDPNADADVDGQSNFEEYRANTNPTNAASVLRITRAEPQTNGFFRLTWSSVGGTRYRVQFSDVTAGFTDAFSDIVRPLATEMDLSFYGSASTQMFLDDFTLTGGTPTNHARFYRIKLVP